MSCSCGAETGARGYTGAWLVQRLRRLGRSASGARLTCRACAERRSEAASLPAPLALKRACRFGSKCYQAGSQHRARYAHPGDWCYRQGRVAFEGPGPEMETLWDIFSYFDSRGSGYLRLEDFSNAACELCRRGMLVSEGSWAEAGRLQRGHVSFAKFCTWAARQGLKLPVGLEVTPSGRRICRAPGCACGELRGDGEACEACGHAARVHTSEATRQGLAQLLLSCRPSHWLSAQSGLVRVSSDAVCEQLRLLLRWTHKASDNWTRDRGCALHGVNACSATCLFQHQAPVPRAYRLTGALRNQSPLLWARYCLRRAAIHKECTARGGCKPHLVESSKEPFGSLDDAPLGGANEWRLFHGSSEAACLSICERNFSLEHCGTGATWRPSASGAGVSLYGPGVYFAERITKADEYSRPSGADGSVFTVLVCRVVAGCPKFCTKNEVDPEALRGEILGGVFHSVMGDRVSELKKPFREVVVYDPDQIYPEFLLTYTRELP